MKWKDDTKIIYFDRRNDKDDTKLLQKVWKYLNEADVVITHNGKKFDTKKLNSRFVRTFINGKRMQPPSSYKQIDTLEIAKSKFNFDSNKLEYLAEFLGVPHLKESHKKFPGHNLWREVLENNPEAWAEMERYNKQDVRVLEDVYNVLVSWDDKINFNLYHDGLDNVCKCGSKDFEENKTKFYYTPAGKFLRFKCRKCGCESRGRKNLLDKEKKATLLLPIAK